MSFTSQIKCKKTGQELRLFVEIEAGLIHIGQCAYVINCISENVYKVYFNATEDTLKTAVSRVSIVDNTVTVSNIYNETIDIYTMIRENNDDAEDTNRSTSDVSSVIASNPRYICYLAKGTKHFIASNIPLAELKKGNYITIGNGTKGETNFKVIKTKTNKDSLEISYKDDDDEINVAKITFNENKWPIIFGINSNFHPIVRYE